MAELKNFGAGESARFLHRGRPEASRAVSLGIFSFGALRDEGSEPVPFWTSFFVTTGRLNGGIERSGLTFWLKLVRCNDR
jgi:hypothetical protein